MNFNQTTSKIQTLASLNNKIPRKGEPPRDWERYFTIVVGKDAAQTPSRLSVRSSTPDATT